MKKTLFIGAGAVLILIVIAAWLYLLLFGNPDSPNELFTDLGFPTDSVAPAIVDPVDTTPLNELVSTSPDERDSLRQLTTRPVVGFTALNSTTVRFAERGVGYIYDVNTVTGEEVRVSGTTIVGVRDAQFSPNGEQFIFTIDTDYRREMIVGEISESNTSLIKLRLPEKTVEAAWLSNTELAYTVTTPTGSEGYTLNLTTEEPIRIFSIPLQDIKTVWAAGDDVYVYNSASSEQRGAMYKVSNSRLIPITDTQFGFVADVINDEFFISGGINIEERTIQNQIQTLSDSRQSPLPILFIPEKCDAAINSTTLWCTAPLEYTGTNLVEQWYQGDIQFSDIVWQVDITNQTASFMTNPLSRIGRNLDLDKVVAASESQALLRNRVDSSLWLYEIF